MSEEILRERMRFHLEAASAYAEELRDVRAQQIIDDLRLEMAPTKSEHLQSAKE